MLSLMLAVFTWSRHFLSAAPVCSFFLLSMYSTTLYHDASCVVPTQSSDIEMTSDEVGRRTSEDSLNNGFDEDAIRQVRLRRANLSSSC